MTRTNFPYEFAQVAGIPIAKEFQDSDKAQPAWALKMLRAAFEGRYNLEEFLANTAWVFQNELPQLEPTEVVQLLASLDFEKILGHYLPKMGYVQGGGRPNSLADYIATFQTDEPTKMVELFRDGRDLDAYFGHNFIGGLNPILLRRVIAEETPGVACLTMSQLHEKMDLSTSMLDPEHFANVDFDDLVAARRLFYVDYHELQDLENGVHPYQETPKYIYSPMIVLGLNDRGQLWPIAIQTGQDPSYACFSPKDGYGWMIAKTIVQAADSSYHEMISHLAHTHLVIEAVALCAKRTFAEGHPVYRLLNPHFEGTFPINQLAVRKLIQPGQAVDRLVGSNMESNYSFIAQCRLNFHVRDRFLPNDLKMRGLDHDSVPAEQFHYHYREDALLVWDAIQNWTRSYLANHYQNDSAVAYDQPLQLWLQDMREAGQLKGLTQSADGQIVTIDELAELLGGLIFIAGSQHAALNFAQGTHGNFTPGANLSGYQPAPKVKRANYTEKDWLAFLPPIDVAILQKTSVTFLSKVQHTRLGHYGLTYFWGQDRRAQLGFLLELRRVEQKIKQRNENREAYVHLLPSRIPQSTNI